MLGCGSITFRQPRPFNGQTGTVMLFGQSVFQSVVTRLEREAEDMAAETEGADGHAEISLSRPFGFAPLGETTMDDDAPANRPLDVYLDQVMEAQQQVAGAVDVEPANDAVPDPMPAHLEKTSLEDVAAELAIDGTDTLDSLGDKRRRFARTNHPDSVAPAFRHNATLRMTAANLLIDQAIRLLPR